MRIERGPCIVIHMTKNWFNTAKPGKNSPKENLLGILLVLGIPAVFATVMVFLDWLATVTA